MSRPARLRWEKSGASDAAWARALMWLRCLSSAPVEEVAVVCEGLAVQQCFLADTGLTVWPDGTRLRIANELSQQLFHLAHRQHDTVLFLEFSRCPHCTQCRTFRSTDQCGGLGTAFFPRIQ